MDFENQWPRNINDMKRAQEADERLRIRQAFEHVFHAIAQLAAPGPNEENVLDRLRFASQALELPPGNQPQPQPHCNTCRYWVPWTDRQVSLFYVPGQEGKIGNCRIRPPDNDSSREPEGRFPLTMADDFCGSWKEKACHPPASSNAS